MITKNELRLFALETRKTFDCKYQGTNIIKNLVSMPEYRKSKNIICYYPLKYEIDTKICFEDVDKNWYLPKVSGNILEICTFGKLKKGSFGIYEPQTAPIKNYSKINMIIIPACAADKKGYRLGYGKGYYDRFLPGLPKECKKVVLIYSNLLFESVYPDEFDIKSDIIVTDKEILRI